MSRDATSCQMYTDDTPPPLPSCDSCNSSNTCSPVAPHPELTDVPRMSLTCTVHTQVEGRVVVDMATAATAATEEAPVGLAEKMAAKGVATGQEESSMLKKMEGILNDYAGNGEGTMTMGGATEKK